MYSVVSKYPAKPWSTELQDTVKRRHWYLLLFISESGKKMLFEDKAKQIFRADLVRG